MFRSGIFMGNNVTILIEKRGICPIEFADLVAFLQKIAGITVMKVFFGAQGMPSGNNALIVPGEDFIIL